MGWPGPNSQTMADEAFEAVKNQVGFKVYDNDKNGYVCLPSHHLYHLSLKQIQVDAFVVVHAGRAAEETGLGSDIWSVKWVLPQEREADGSYNPHLGLRLCL